MTDMAYIVSRMLEHKIAIAENNDQIAMLVTLDVLKEILFALKEQEEEIENLKQTAQSMMEGVCLLKEQEAKQIVRKQCKKEHKDGSIDYFAEWYCPHCNSLIVRGFDNPSIKFCYKCGKPITWESR